MRRFILISAVVVLAIVFCLPAQNAQAATKAQLTKQFEARNAELQKYKNKAKIGETFEGMVEAVKAADMKDPKIKKLVTAENADRKELYAIIAKEQSVGGKKFTPEQVGRNNVPVKFKKAADSELFKGKDGKWLTKKQMIDAAKKKK